MLAQPPFTSGVQPEAQPGQHGPGRHVQQPAEGLQRHQRLLGLPLPAPRLLGLLPAPVALLLLAAARLQGGLARAGVDLQDLVALPAVRVPVNPFAPPHQHGIGPQVLSLSPARRRRVLRPGPAPPPLILPDGVQQRKRGPSRRRERRRLSRAWAMPASARAASALSRSSAGRTRASRSEGRALSPRPCRDARACFLSRSDGPDGASTSPGPAAPPARAAPPAAPARPATAAPPRPRPSGWRGGAG